MKQHRHHPIDVPSHPAEATTSPADISYEAIARRAYERYVERGCTCGQDVDDWLFAERELRDHKGEPSC